MGTILRVISTLWSLFEKEKQLLNNAYAYISLVNSKNTEKTQSARYAKYSMQLC